MTEENYNYRTSQALLRNQFPGTGKLQIPMTTKLSGSTLLDIHPPATNQLP